MIFSRASIERKGSACRSRARRQPLGVEGLEARQMMTGNTGIDANPWSVVVTGADVGARSTPLVSVVDPTTGTVVRSFLAYESTFRGGVRVAVGDVNGDDMPDIITAPGTGRVGEIRVFSLSGTEMAAYRTLPFGPAWRGGVEVASGDVDGNGRADLVASQSRGRGEVRVFASVNATDPIANAAIRTIVPFGPRFNGGSTVAVADVGTFTNGALTNASTPDGRVEIVIGNGPGMRSLVRVYDVSATPRVVATVQPFASTFQGGVAVSSGRDSTGDLDDLIVSAGRGGGGTVFFYDGQIGSTPGGGLVQLGSVSTSFGRQTSPIYTTPVSLAGNGRSDRLFVAKGDPHSGVNVGSYLPNGEFVGQGAVISGPVRIAAGKAPLSSPATGFRTKSSGLQYRDLFVGYGASPTVSQTITAHYVGKLADGTVFESSRASGTPLTIQLGSLIEGWIEGVSTMRVGGRRILIIPPALAYGNNPPPGSGIPPGATLTFEIELLAIS